MMNNPNKVYKKILDVHIDVWYKNKYCKIQIEINNILFLIFIW